jgi:hypothetical protein
MGQDDNARESRGQSKLSWEQQVAGPNRNRDHHRLAQKGAQLHALL